MFALQEGEKSGGSRMSFDEWYRQYMLHVRENRVLESAPFDYRDPKLFGRDQEFGNGDLWGNLSNYGLFESQLAEMALGHIPPLQRVANSMKQAGINLGNDYMTVDNFSYPDYLLSMMAEQYRAMTVYSMSGETISPQAMIGQEYVDLKLGAVNYQPIAPVMSDISLFWALSTLDANGIPDTKLLNSIADWQRDIALLSVSGNAPDKLYGTHRSALGISHRFYKYGRNIYFNHILQNDGQETKPVIFSRSTLVSICAVACWKFPKLVQKYPELAQDFDQIFTEEEPIGSEAFLIKARDLQPVFEELFGFYMLGFGRLIARQIHPQNRQTGSDHYPPMPPMFFPYRQEPKHITDWREARQALQ